MSSPNMQPITLHGHLGPNPWKIALVLEELSLPYDTKIWQTADQKRPPFTTKLNPNGFTPVIEDPNTGITLWESGAIIEYLLETYDKSRRISFPWGPDQKHADLLKWIFFHSTFQAPNISAARYFTLVQPNPEARQRFVTESVRVLGILEGALQGKDYLVGTFSAADIVYITFTQSLKANLGDDTPILENDFPRVAAWMGRMGERESVRKVTGERLKVVKTAAAAPTAKEHK